MPNSETTIYYTNKITQQQAKQLCHATYDAINNYENETKTNRHLGKERYIMGDIPFYGGFQYDKNQAMQFKKFDNPVTIHVISAVAPNLAERKDTPSSPKDMEFYGPTNQNGLEHYKRSQKKLIKKLLILSNKKELVMPKMGLGYFLSGLSAEIRETYEQAARSAWVEAWQEHQQTGKPPTHLTIMDKKENYHDLNVNSINFVEGDIIAYCKDKSPDCTMINPAHDASIGGKYIRDDNGQIIMPVNKQCLGDKKRKLPLEEQMAHASYGKLIKLHTIQNTNIEYKQFPTLLNSKTLSNHGLFELAKDDSSVSIAGNFDIEKVKNVSNTVTQDNSNTLEITPPNDIPPESKSVTVTVKDSSNASESSLEITPTYIKANGKKNCTDTSIKAMIALYKASDPGANTFSVTFNHIPEEQQKSFITEALSKNLLPNAKTLTAMTPEKFIEWVGDDNAAAIQFVTNLNDNNYPLMIDNGKLAKRPGPQPRP